MKVVKNLPIANMYVPKNAYKHTHTHTHTHKHTHI